MRCVLCGFDLVPSFFGPLVNSEMGSIPCRGGYPLYEENGMHVTEETTDAA